MKSFTPLLLASSVMGFVPVGRRVPFTTKLAAEMPAQKFPEATPAATESEDIRWTMQVLRDWDKAIPKSENETVHYYSDYVDTSEFELPTPKEEEDAGWVSNANLVEVKESSEEEEETPAEEEETPAAEEEAPVEEEETPAEEEEAPVEDAESATDATDGGEAEDAFF